MHIAQLQIVFLQPLPGLLQRLAQYIGDIAHQRLVAEGQIDRAAVFEHLALFRILLDDGAAWGVAVLTVRHHADV